MYEYNFNKEWNDFYAANNVTLKVNYSKQGNLELDNVFFIVGPDTYSASELTMNNLKPYMTVKLVGSTTGGKPVGFIPASIYIVNDTTKQETYAADLYAINFETKNALQQGGYFFGIDPDQSEGDYVDVNWGDTSDPNLADIFGYIKNGSFSRNQARLSEMKGFNIFRNAPSPVLSRRFNGMVDYRLNLKRKSISKLK